MPPSARLPTVEFRSLLLPPVRVRLCAFESLCRPQHVLPIPHAVRPPCNLQRRYLNLYVTAKAKTVLGMHKVLPFDKYDIAPPTASEHRVSLVGGKNPKDLKEIIAADITLQELYDRVKPGQLLHLTAEVPKRIAGKVESLKAEDAASIHKYYSLFEPYTIPGNRVDPKKGKGPGALRCLPLNLESPVAYYRLNLDRAYQFIEAGSPVEFRLRLKGATEKKEQRMKPGDINNWIWLHNHFPHLRPDFILKSMPKGSSYMIEPVSDGKKVQFVIAKPHKNITQSVSLTKRLFKVKASVEASVDKGSQGQLPKVVRSELFTTGNRNYSPLTGLPREQVEAAFGEENPEHLKLFEDRDGERVQPSSDRYMVPERKQERHRTLGGHLVGRTKKAERDRLNISGNLMGNKQRSNRKYRREEVENPFPDAPKVTS